MKKIFVLFSMCALMMVGTSAFAQEGQHNASTMAKNAHTNVINPKS